MNPLGLSVLLGLSGVVLGGCRKSHEHEVSKDEIAWGTPSDSQQVAWQMHNVKG